MTEAKVGATRVPVAGSFASGAPDRMTIHPFPAFFGRVKFPANTAPGSSVITSPGCAAFSAACKSPPAATAIVRPDGAVYEVSRNTRGGAGGTGAGWPGDCARTGQLKRKWLKT